MQNIDYVIRMREVLGINTRPKKYPVPPHPMMLERRYATALSRIVRQWREGTATVLAERLPLWISESRLIRQDQDEEEIEPLGPADTEGSLSDKVAAALAAVFLLGLPRVPGVSRRVGADTLRLTRLQWARSVEFMTSVQISPLNAWEPQLLRNFVGQNTALITGLSAETRNAVTTAIVRGIQEGRTGRQIERDILGTGLPAGPFRKATNRAKLIAADQVQKLVGKSTELNQAQFGIKSYTWRTRKDDRVREEHRVREGKRFFWKSPPRGGHPGQAINCRCYAEPRITSRQSRRMIQAADKRTRRILGV